MRLGRAGGKVRGHQLDHLAGADEQHADVAQVLEQLRRQPHRGGGHADAVRADLGGWCAPPWPPKAALEQLVQRGAQRAGFVGLAHRLLHLAQDLRLAQHHRIQPGGHAEGVARGFGVTDHRLVVLRRIGAVTDGDGVRDAARLQFGRAGVRADEDIASARLDEATGSDPDRRVGVALAVAQRMGSHGHVLRCTADALRHGAEAEQHVAVAGIHQQARQCADADVL
jgi:hypothetical protein